ncbi:hypothetical protein D9M70_632240 [compost metagenome]
MRTGYVRTKVKFINDTVTVTVRTSLKLGKANLIRTHITFIYYTVTVTVFVTETVRSQYIAQEITVFSVGVTGQ